MKITGSEKQISWATEIADGLNIEQLLTDIRADIESRRAKEAPASSRRRRNRGLNNDVADYYVNKIDAILKRGWISASTLIEYRGQIAAFKNENVNSRPIDLVKIVAWEDVDGIESNWEANNAII